MGLELTEDVIRENMPEYLPGAANSVNQVSSGTLICCEVRLFQRCCSCQIA